MNENLHNVVITDVQYEAEPKRTFPLHPTFSNQDITFLREAIAMKNEKDKLEATYIEKLLLKIDGLKGAELGDSE